MAWRYSREGGADARWQAGGNQMWPGDLEGDSSARCHRGMRERRSGLEIVNGKATFPRTPSGEPDRRVLRSWGSGLSKGRGEAVIFGLEAGRS